MSQSTASAVTPSISIPTSIWALGFVSFLMKMSSVIVFTLTPLFITGVLGISTFVLGLMEGAVEFLSLFTRVFAGVISDFMRKRKAIIILGYILACLSRPFLAMASNAWFVFAGRSLDRIGNGLDATPRDALVGDLAPPSIKGECYGLRETLSRTGAFLGSLLCMALLWLTSDDYPLVFWIGSIPIFAALLILVLYVKDPVSEEVAQTKTKEFKSPIQFSDFQNLPRAYWFVLITSGIFMLSNFSGAFLILAAKNQDIPVWIIPLTMVIQNFATSISAYPVGYLSDRIDRRLMLGIGFLIVALSDLCLYWWESQVGVMFGIFLWGLQLGFTQSILVTLVADTSPAKIRGTSFGTFHLSNGVCLLAANGISGYLWGAIGPQATYTASAIAALAAICVLPFIKMSKEKSVA